MKVPVPRSSVPESVVALDTWVKATNTARFVVGKPPPAWQMFQNPDSPEMFVVYARGKLVSCQN